MVLRWGYYVLGEAVDVYLVTGALAFDVREARFEATPSTFAGSPGDQVTVGFRSEFEDVRITGRTIALREVSADCPRRDEWTATVAVPPTGLPESLQTDLMWTVHCSAGYRHRGRVTGRESFRIDPLHPHHGRRNRRPPADEPAATPHRPAG